MRVDIVHCGVDPERLFLLLQEAEDPVLQPDHLLFGRHPFGEAPVSFQIGLVEDLIHGKEQFRLGTEIIIKLALAAPGLPEDVLQGGLFIAFLVKQLPCRRQDGFPLEFFVFGIFLSQILPLSGNAMCFSCGS